MDLGRTMAELESGQHPLSPICTPHQIIPFTSIRGRQDSQLTLGVCQEATALSGAGGVSGPSFFAGSVDFMVWGGGKSGSTAFSIIEANGGNTRGWGALPLARQLFAGYLEMLRFAPRNPVILIGHLPTDRLIHEKVLLALLLQEGLKRYGEEALILTFEEVLLRPPRGALILLADYDRINQAATVGWDGSVRILGRKVNAIIGDHVVVRHSGMRAALRQGRLEVVLANPTEPVTTSKYLTYVAAQELERKLTSLNCYPLRAWRAYNERELQAVVAEGLKRFPLVIKPDGGSGGVGVRAVYPDSDVAGEIAGSFDEFYTKYGGGLSPWPYTICEMVKPRYAERERLFGLRRSGHNFDVRVNVTRQGDFVVPVGLIFRLSLGTRRENQTVFGKEQLVVNLSGYRGTVDMNRGLPLNQRSLKVTRLAEDDLVRMLAAAVLLTTHIAGGYRRLVRQYG